MRNRPFRASTPAAFLANILIPGLGHVIRGEVLFGIFVFLVMLIAVVLFVVSLLVPIPPLAKSLLLGLPLLFYAFTFLDLARSIRFKPVSQTVTRKLFSWIILIGILYQLLSPAAPVNFALNNLPELFIQPDNHLSPIFTKGEFLKASRISYFVNLAILDRPVVYSLPSRYDIVRFLNGDNLPLSGIILGLPGEDIQVAEGVVIVNTYPDTQNGPAGLALQGDWPLTRVDDYSILVATVNLGVVQNVYQVPFRKVVGKVGKLL